MKKTSMYSLILLNTLAIFTLLGCGNGSGETLNNEDDKNKEVIEVVLEKTLNAPDKVLLSKLYDSDNATIINQDEQSSTSSVQEKENDFDQYIEENYGEYFTDYGFEKFFITSGEGYRYSDEADKANYTLAPEDISIIQDEKNDQRYEFDVTVKYIDEKNDEGTRVLNGRVEMDDGKINSLNINDDEGLLKEIMSNP
ncbi:hypothetical protein SAMN04488700_0795 [Carnobacterium iners]|uniref:DUF5105 domain-containing protein n=1 Tax=Carnobacterium iners TaxID=1073423 RepID=A0A1X7MT04_9LACT|nr:hypothetical protein [Carnobacterium iners]SEL06638.1 hypothetical protein SAMN04488114_12323 [Carnobacterium iners]SMH27942.1 hypothetical protein SAMN04488700_0795 [Carnobacterium iners]